MTIFRHVTILAVLGLAPAACAPGKPAASAAGTQLTVARTTAVRDSVKALLSEFTERMNKSDMDGVAKLYSTDSSFFWIEGAAVRYQSAKDVRDALQTLKNVPQIELKFYETRVDVLSPTIANVHTEFSQSFMNGAGRGDTYGGYMTITVVREGGRMAHAKWTYVIEEASALVALVTSSADKFTTPATQAPVVSRSLVATCQEWPTEIP